MRLQSAAIAAIFAVILVACDGLTDPGRCDGSFEESDLVVDLRPGEAPMFSWTPRCGVEGLRVLVDGAPTYVWNIAGDPLVRPPVRYGQVPGGAEELEPAEDLQPGVSYRFALMYSDGGTGIATFSPPFVP